MERRLLRNTGAILTPAFQLNVALRRRQRGKYRQLEFNKNTTTLRGNIAAAANLKKTKL